MRLDELVTSLRDAVTDSRVFGQPYEHDGVTVIPAAIVREAPVAAPGRRRTPARRAKAAASACSPVRPAPT